MYDGEVVFIIMKYICNLLKNGYMFLRNNIIVFCSLEIFMLRVLKEKS